MRLKFFSIPAFDLEAAETELNRFLASHRIHKIDRHFVQDGSASYWCLCVLYQEKTGRATPEKRDRVDYKELLNEEEFALFAKLRDLRKHLANEEGVPVYTVFNNAQLAEMVQQRVQTLAQLQKIDGVGEARVSKYGQAFLDQVHQAILEQNTGEKTVP
jgi:superfamily II DNA helicase RecQ